MVSESAKSKHQSLNLVVKDFRQVRYGSESIPAIVIVCQVGMLTFTLYLLH